MTIYQVIGTYFKYVTNQKLRYAITMIIIVFTSLFTVLIPLVYGQIVDVINSGELSESWRWLWVLVIVLIFDLVFDQLKYHVGDKILIDDLFIRMRTKYIDTLQQADYNYHLNKSSGSLISLAKRGESALFTAFWEVNSNAFRLLVRFLITNIIVFFINFWLGLALLAIIIIQVIIGTIFIRINVKRRKKLNDEDDVITGITVDNLIGFETVKIFANENYELNRLKRAFISWREAQFNYIISFRMIDISLGVLTIIGFITIIGGGLYLLEQEILALGLLVTAMLYIFDISSQLASFIYKLRELGKTYADLVKYFEVLAIKPKIKSNKNPVRFKPKKSELSVEFKNVDFSYPDTNQSLFKNLNLLVKPQQKIALVGESGAGKTTLTKLIMRFFDVNSGQIELAGIPIKNISIANLRNSIGLVPQEPILFNETIKFNLTYGKITATDSEIIDALKKSNLYDFITNLPKGLDTYVGERGIKLSGGQRQRLAIARVLIEDPPLIIFDEATSQLDSANEKQIQEAYQNLAKDRTTITVAHRLSTIKQSDMIYVFDDGEIIEAGTHDELTQNKKTYAKLWQLQADIV